MDQLTTLRELGALTPGPGDAALARGRLRLAARIADSAADARREVSANGETVAAPDARSRASSAETRRNAPPARRARRAFVALAALAAAALIAGVLITDQLGLGTSGTVGPASPAAPADPASTAAAPPSASSSAATPSPGRTSFPSGFRLPASCSDALGGDILPVWSAAFGDAGVLDESGYTVPGTDETGVHCSYGSSTGGSSTDGSSTGGPMLTIIVGTVDSAAGGQQRAEAQQDSSGTSRQPFGAGTLFLFQPGLTPSPASLTFIDGTASISVAVQGTNQDSGNLLTFLRAALDDIGRRTGAAVGAPGSAPLPDCSALGAACGTAWVLNRS